MTEKKLYLILNESIYGVGGSFVYIMNKLNYYKRKGFEVCCIHGGHDMFPIIVPKLKIFKDNREPAVRIPVFYFSKTQRKKIANTIIKKYHLDKYDEVIIESSTYNQATWGEYISYLIGAKHFVLLLAEKPVIVDINAFNFLKFKYERMELCGIVQKSLQFLFDDKLVIPTEKSYYLPCYCNNSIDDVSFHYDENMLNVDYTIGCLGRFDKPYFLSSLIDLRKYFLEHSDKIFGVILIGQSNSKAIRKKIDNVFEGLDNVRIFKTGNLFPIPLKLLQKADVFIASAGSCTTIRYAGVNVISYDCKDLKPIGIYKKTTSHSLFRSEEDTPCTLDELLNMLLIDKMYQDDNPVADMKAINEIDFSEHHSFLEQSCQVKRYYNFDSVVNSTTIKFATCLTSCFSANFLFWVLDTFREKLKLNFSLEQLLAKYKNN